VWLLGTGLVVENGASDAAGHLASAELYDPKSGTFTHTGLMTTARSGHTATSLQKGQVLIAGGTSNGGSSGGVTSAELYDPRAGTFSVTGSMKTMRTGHTATLLTDGHVLIAGGATASAELYDPHGGTFTTTGSLKDSGLGAKAVPLPDGRVFVLREPDGDPELHDPKSGLFTDSELALGLGPTTATLLSDGRVLVAGGMSSNSVRAYLYRP